MPSANETIKPADRRTAPEIINSIQKRLKAGNSKQPSILEDILILDKLAQRQTPAGIMAYPAVNEYIQAVGNDKGVKTVFKELSSKASSDEQKQNFRRLSVLLGLTEIKKPHRKTHKLSLKQKAVLGLGALGALLTPADLRSASQATRELPQPTPVARLAESPRRPVLVSELPKPASRVDLPTPQAAPIVSQTTESPPSPRALVVPTAQPPPPETKPPEEELIPNPIRALQNPEFNRLWKAGCLDTKEITMGGRKIMVVDFVKKPGVKCDLKFPQIYEAYPVQGRMTAYKLGDESQIRLAQIDMDCAIHSFAIASLIAKQRANPNETPVVVNPLLYAEADKSLTPELYKQLRDQIIHEPSNVRRYGLAEMQKLADSSVINYALLRPNVTEKILSSVEGIEAKRNILLTFPELDPKNPNKAYLKKEAFTDDEWKQLQQKYTFTVEGNRVNMNRDTANKLFGVWMEKWYLGLNHIAEQNNQVSVPVFDMRFFAEGVPHAYTITGIKEVSGKKYFQATEGLAGVLSSYLAEKGVIHAEGGTVLIPLDKMWDIGLFEAYTFTANKPPKIHAAETSASSEIQKNSSGMIGFRVNDAESIYALPPQVNTIRIAGNLTEVDEKGQFKDQEITKMLEAAKEKNLKVIFVYNPNWFPGIPEPQTRYNPWTWKEVEKNIESKGQEIRSQIRRQINQILQYNNVVLEIGNEPNENSTRHAHTFWKGDFKSFLKFYEWSALEADEIVKAQKLLNPNRPEVRLLTPALTHMEDQTQNYKDMEALLKQLDSKIKLPIDIAMHTYDLESFKFQLGLISKIFGNRKIIVTEANSDTNKPGNLQELKAMLDFAQKNKIPFIVHEFKSNPVFANQKDYAFGGLFVITPNDQKYNMLIENLNALIQAQRQTAETPPGPIGMALPREVYDNLNLPQTQIPGRPPIQILETDGTATQV